MRCICDDRTHPPRQALWHRAFCAWYDHDRAGRRVRARAWGFIADRLAHLA